jgi:hypothetical protein
VLRSSEVGESIIEYLRWKCMVHASCGWISWYKCTKQNWITVDISASLLLLLSIFNLTTFDIYIFCHNTGSNSLKAFANWYQSFA